MVSNGKEIKKCGGCIPYYSSPSAKLSCGPSSCTGGGNLPNGPLDMPIGCCSQKKQHPADLCPSIDSLSPLAAVIVCVVQLKDPSGVTSEQILDYYTNTLYPLSPSRQQITLFQVDALVAQAVRQGALRKTSSANGRVVVYSFFGDLPSNSGLVKEFGGSDIYQSCLGLFCLKRPS